MYLRSGWNINLVTGAGNSG